MTRILIAIALTALAFIPAAQAVQSVEADNGAVYEIARILPTGFGGVQVLVIPPGAPGDLVTPMQIQFDCHGHIRTYGGALEYVPPRSVASGIEKIACTGIKETTKKMRTEFCAKSGACVLEELCKKEGHCAPDS